MKNKTILFTTFGAGAYWTTKFIYKKIKERNFSFENKVVVITGGSRGLGLVIARQLAEEGAKLVICARNKEELKKAEAELYEKGADVLSVVCDVTDWEQVNHLADQTINHFGKVNVLINNAGIIEVSPFDNTTIEDFERHMEVHFKGPLNTMMAFIPHMKEHRKNRIVNISSIGGKISVPHLLPYSASKFALTGLSEGMHMALKEKNISVTTVCPWLMRTGSPRNIDVKGQHELEYKLFKTSGSLPLADNFC